MIDELRVIEGRWLEAGKDRIPCTIGRGGLIAADVKREGDGATPVGRWPLRRLLFRPDRIEPAPQTALPVLAISEQDGWCDAPGDPLYNQPVPWPYLASAEHLWRSDGVYDLLIVLGHNDEPVVPGLGSAIFFHLMADDGRATEGCIAIEREAMLSLLPRLSASTSMVVEPADTGAD